MTSTSLQVPNQRHNAGKKGKKKSSLCINQERFTSSPLSRTNANFSSVFERVAQKKAAVTARSKPMSLGRWGRWSTSCGDEKRKKKKQRPARPHYRTDTKILSKGVVAKWDQFGTVLRLVSDRLPFLKH